MKRVDVVLTKGLIKKKPWYYPGSICSLESVIRGEPQTNAEAKQQIDDFMAEGRKKKLCVRCLINSDGRQQNSTKGLRSCKVCGGSVFL